MAFAEDSSVFFDTAGFAVAAVYTPAGGSPVNVEVIKDRFLQQTGGESYATELRTSILFQKSQVSSPRRGDTVVVDGTTYTLQAKIDEDEIVSTWAVT